MSFPLSWRGWDIPWALLSVIPRGLTPIPEGFATFLQFGQARGTCASWKGVEILQRFTSSLVFYPSLEHPCGALWCQSLSPKKHLKSLCIVGFTQPNNFQPLPPKLNKSPFSQTRNFCSQLPVEIWDGEALPTALAAPGPFADGNRVLWDSGVAFGGALKHLGVI